MFFISTNFAVSDVFIAGTDRIKMQRVDKSRANASFVVELSEKHLCVEVPVLYSSTPLYTKHLCIIYN